MIMDTVPPKHIILSARIDIENSKYSELSSPKHIDNVDDATFIFLNFVSFSNLKNDKRLPYLRMFVIVIITFVIMSNILLCLY